METIFFFYRKAVISFKQFRSLHKRKDLTAVGLVGLACKHAHLCEFMEDFTGVKKNSARKHFFPDSQK